MIITKTPLRIPLGGGGTDLPEFYSRFGGRLLTAAINRHIFVFVQRWFEEGIKVGYSKTEIVQSVDDIQHPVVREALRLSGISSHIEVHSMAELPSQTALGSSSTHTAGLLKALGLYTGTRLGTKVQQLLRTKEIGLLSEKALLAGRLDDFGYLLDEHWTTKQKISNHISNGRVNELYCVAREAGAYGGKLMGAGGGGFLMIYCPVSKKQNVRKAL